MRFSNLPLDYFTFQFHKGTIRTFITLSSDSAALSFQFHKGTIRTRELIQERTQSAYFNSIKVQLELAFFLAFFLKIIFQFHKGTIRTFSRLFTLYSLILFQFHKGTIRTVLIGLISSMFTISIP